MDCRITGNSTIWLGIMRDFFLVISRDIEKQIFAFKVLVPERKI